MLAIELHVPLGKLIEEWWYVYYWRDTSEGADAPLVNTGEAMLDNFKGSKDRVVTGLTEIIGLQ